MTKMYNLNIWWHFFQFAVLMIGTSVFIFKVFEHKLKVSPLCFWLIISAYTAIISLIIALTLTEISPHRDRSVEGILFIIGLSIVTLKIMIKKNGLSLFFLFFLFLNIQYNTLTLAKVTLSFSFFLQPFQYAYANVLVLSLAYDLFLLPILYYLLAKLYKRIIDEEISFKGMEIFSCLPAGFFFLLCSFLSQIHYTSESIKYILFPVILTNVCAFISYFAVLKSVLEAHDASLKNQELYSTKMKQLILEDQCANLQAQITSDSRARHDWRHHIITIIGLIDKQDLAGLNAYLAEYKDKYLSTDTAAICNVDALDMLFQYYKRRADELGIIFTINSIALDISCIAVSDLIVLFGNLLVNAVEACERVNTGSKYITLKIRNQEKNVIAIICENSFDGIVLREDGVIISRKKDGGLGLSSIETIVEKYNGVLDFKISEKTFKIYAALHSSKLPVQ